MSNADANFSARSNAKQEFGFGKVLLKKKHRWVKKWKISSGEIVHSNFIIIANKNY